MYKHFITTGCSFTSGVIPDQSLTHWESAAFSWPHYCYLELDPVHCKFLNFALPGGGNIAAITNLIHYLELHPELDTSEILVGINFTGLDRLDTVACATHPAANADYSNQHIAKELGVAWIHTAIQDRLCLGSELTIQTCVSIVAGICYLEAKNIDYFFMLMNSSVYDHAPVWFKQFLDARKTHWVTFDTGMGMAEFVAVAGLATPDGHPSKQGHRAIADQVLKHIHGC